MAAAYTGFRCLLLHNFSADHTLGFTHAEPHRHLQIERGRVVLDRGSFIADIASAFDAFERDVLADDQLAGRVLAWLDMGRPPIGFWMPPDSVPGASGASMAVSATMAWSGTNTTARATAGHAHDRTSEKPTLASSIKKPRKEKNKPKP